MRETAESIRTAYQAAKVAIPQTLRLTNPELDVAGFAAMPYSHDHPPFLQALFDAMRQSILHYEELNKGILLERLTVSLKTTEEVVFDTLKSLEERFAGVFLDEPDTPLERLLSRLSDGTLNHWDSELYMLLKLNNWYFPAVSENQEHHRLFYLEVKPDKSEEEVKEATQLLMRFSSSLRRIWGEIVEPIADFKYYYWLRGQKPEKLVQSLEAYFQANPREGNLKLRLNREQLGWYLRWWLEVFTEGESQTRVAEAFGTMLGLSPTKLRQAISSSDLEEAQKQQVRDLVQKHLDLLH